MKHHPISMLGGFMAGALAMYYLDASSGPRRRALVRDKVVATSHTVVHKAGRQGRRAANRIKGVLATGRLDRVSHAAPHSDQQLHDRIRARIGHLASHPKAIGVSVEEACVRLHGHVLRREVERLCHEVSSMAGVRELRTDLLVHDTPESLLQEFQHRGAAQAAAKDANAESTNASAADAAESDQATVGIPY